jgi:site-specific DNA recombinase
VLIDVHDVALGHTTKQRWNEAGQWIYSDQVVHPPIVGTDTFSRAQALLAAKASREVIKRPRTSPHAYPLRGLLYCGICNRRIQGSRNNDQSYYRCTYPSQYATANQISHPRTVYLREADILPTLDSWLGKTFDPSRLPATLDDLANAQQDQPPETAALRDLIRDSARQLAQYRAALDSGGDPAIVGQWINETQARKLAAEAQLRTFGAQAPRRLTKEEIQVLINAITDVITVLRDADPQDKAALYGQLGLKLTYNPGAKTVTARARLGDTCTKRSCPRGDSTATYMGEITGELLVGAEL